MRNGMTQEVNFGVQCWSPVYHVTEVDGVALTFKLLFWRNLVKFLSGTLAFVTEAFHGFLQSLQANANVVSNLDTAMTTVTTFFQLTNYSTI
jgi:hypothetical protein